MELILEVRELMAAVRAVAEFGTKQDWLRAVKLALGLLTKLADAFDSPPISGAAFAGEPRSLVELCGDLEKELALAEGPAPAHAEGGLAIVLLPLI